VSSIEIPSSKVPSGLPSVAEESNPEESLIMDVGSLISKN